MIAVFTYVLDSTIASVALPYMAGSFSVTRDESMWILTSYMIACGIMVPMVDWFCKLCGRKAFFIISVLIFTTASMLCGMSHNIEMMIFARILQGAGGGGILPIVQAIMMETFEGKERPKAMAVFGLGVILAPVIGPTLGGWITDNWAWPWIFYINVPLGCIAAILSKKLIFDPPYAKKQKDLKVDVRGFLYLTVWLVTLQVVLDKGNNADWFNADWICWTTLVSVIAAALFFRSQIKYKDTLVDLSVFKDKNFSTGTFIQVVVQGVLYSSLVLLPQFLQGMMGYNASLSGLAIMPRGIGSLISMSICGVIASKLDGRWLTAAGLAMVGAASLIFGSLNLQIASINIVIPNFIMGFGLGLAMIPLISITVQTLKNEQMTNASGLNNLLKTIGGAIGTSLVATMLTRFAQIHQYMMVKHLSELNPEFVRNVQAMTAVFSRIAHPSDANYMANSLIYKQLLQQATLWAFMDAFRLIGIVCFLVIPLVFLLKPSDNSAQSSAH
ncbi:MAG: DHA2 family efflux MFS transporter permease subunit [Heliobacteriaceae bacterium]|jgi:DHA2 family multidrug resistance protein|nr:DHA2 family efflux MFS transporter permease subunit [Heliobacteriaceae bacterium]